MPLGEMGISLAHSCVPLSAIGRGIDAGSSSEGCKEGALLPFIVVLVYRDTYACH